MANQSEDDNILVVVDRSSNNTDVLHLSTYEDAAKLRNLDRNYLIGMDFHITKTDNDIHDTIRAYLKYGIDQSIRFYPETLTSIVPRLFFRNSTETFSEYMFKLHANDFKHGFSCDLFDPGFNAIYKTLTKYDHISVNFNRKSMADNDDVKYGNNDADECNMKHILPCQKCRHIQYIIGSLKQYLLCEYQITQEDEDTFDTKLLSKAQEHIIRVHKICSDVKQRTEIQNYIQHEVGKCELPTPCRIVNNHSLRETEAKSLKKKVNALAISGIIERKILLSLLYSLHTYLIHNDDELYRLRRTDKYSKLHFSSQTTNINDVADEDMTELELILRFMMQNGVSKYAILHTNKWMIDNEYDSDAIYADLDELEEDKTQSNFYQHLNKNKISSLFELILIQFLYSKQTSVASMNFGDSVLTWLFNEQQPHSTNLKEEFIGNLHKYSDGAKTYQEYAAACAIKVNNNPADQYILNEMLCLKIYTDETALQNTFRKSFWSTARLHDRKCFYWWAIMFYKTILFHGQPIAMQSAAKKSKPTILYHGLNNIFIINEQTPMYHGPISTTKADSVAERFCDSRGLIWYLTPSYFNPFKSLYGVDVDWISQFGEESEILLYNSFLPISKTINFSKTAEGMINQLIHQLKVYKSKIVNVNKFYMAIGFILDPEWIDKLKTHKLLYDSVKYDDETTVIQRLVQELNVIELTPLFIVHSTKFKLINVKANKAFGMSDYGLYVSKKNDTYFNGCKYKAVSVKSYHEFEVSYPNTFFLEPNNEYKIYVINPDIFGAAKYIYMQTVKTTKLGSRLCDNLKAIQNNTFIIAENTERFADIDDVVSNAKYFVSVTDSTDVIFDPQNTMGNMYQTVDNVSHFQLLIPFRANSNSCKVYVQPKDNSKFRLMCDVKFTEDCFTDSTEHRVQYLLNLVKNYRYSVSHEQQIGLKISEMHIEMIQKQEPLYSMTINGKSILHRLVNELRVITDQLYALDIFENNCGSSIEGFFNNLEVSKYNNLIICKNQTPFTQKMDQTISNAKYFVTVTNSTDVVIDEVKVSDAYQCVDGIISFQLLIPFEAQQDCCNIYIQPNKHCKFSLISCINLKQNLYKNTVEDNIDYLLCTLKKYRYKLSNIKQIGFDISEQHKNELIDVIKKNDLLYVTTICGKSMIHRLAFELKIVQLDDMLAVAKFLNEFSSTKSIHQSGTICKQFIKNVKIEEDNNFIIIDDMKEITTNMNENVANASFFVTTETTTTLVIDKSEVIDRCQKVKNIETFQLLIPFDADSKSCSIFIQPYKNCNFIYLAEMEFSHKKHKHVVKNHIQYLLSVLKNYKYTLSVQQVGFEVSEQHKNELVDVIKKNDLLHVATMCGKSMIHRLIFELGIFQLQLADTEFVAKFPNEIAGINYKQFIKHFKIEEDSNFIIVDDVKEITANMNENVANASFFVTTETTTALLIDKAKVIDRCQKVKNIEQFQLLVPFDADSKSCSIFIQPYKDCHFIFLAEMGPTYKKPGNAVKNHVNYLLNVLKNYKYPLSVQQVGFDIRQQHKIELIDIIEKKDLLYADTMCGQTMIHRLVHEIKVQHFSNKLNTFQQLTSKQKENTFKTALIIDFPVRASTLHDSENGVLKIFSEKDIVIGKNGIITADGSGMTVDDSYYDDEKAFDWFDKFTQMVGNAASSQSRGGGIIEIISMGNIVNKGKITSNGIHGGTGGLIRIKCQKFINEGKVSCLGESGDGKICIHSNNANDIPVESLLGLSNLKMQNITKKHENINHTLESKPILTPITKIKLLITKSRGSSCGCNVQNVLCNDTRFYWSKEVNGDETDWIIFACDGKGFIVPTQIKLRNARGFEAVSEIALFYSDDSSLWKKLGHIKNIKKNYCIGDLQCFDIYSPNVDYHKFKYLKLDMIKNHGSKHYFKLHYFSLFGMKVFS
eukprot:61505_1